MPAGVSNPQAGKFHPHQDVRTTASPTFGGTIFADATPIGLDILYSGLVGNHLTVGNNLTVGGTLDVSGNLTVDAVGRVLINKSPAVGNSKLQLGTSLFIDGTNAIHFGSSAPLNEYINSPSAGVIELGNRTKFRVISDSNDNGNATDELFGVYDASLATNRFFVEKDGKIGIGTIAPTALFDINSDILRLRTAKTPASATATGNQGDICWDADYIYICIATDSWKRSAIGAW